MPFCVGNHLTLRAPLTGVGRFEQIRVFAPIRRAHLVTKLGLLGDATELNFREGVSLADARLHDLVVGPFVPGQALVRLIDPSGIELEVSQQELAVNAGRVSPDQFYFVFYADAGAGLFCPEPWLGLPNSLGTGTAAVGLEPGGIFEWEMAARATLPQGKPIQLA
jgi:galactose mutarotase-like enzyme